MSQALDLIESIDSLLAMNEISARRTISFSGGRRHIKLRCGPGFKLVNNVCQRMRSSELLSRRRAAKRAVRVRRSHRSQISRKRQLTMRRRHSAGF